MQWGVLFIEDIPISIVLNPMSILSTSFVVFAAVIVVVWMHICAFNAIHILTGCLRLLLFLVPFYSPHSSVYLLDCASSHSAFVCCAAVECIYSLCALCISICMCVLSCVFNLFFSFFSSFPLFSRCKWIIVHVNERVSVHVILIRHIPYEEINGNNLQESFDSNKKEIFRILTNLCVFFFLMI